MPKEENKTTEVVAEEEVKATEPKKQSSEIEALKQQIEDMKSLLHAVADKNKLEEFEEKRKSKSSKVVNLSTYYGKLVVSWTALTKNLVQKVGGKQWIEDQKTVLTYRGGETEEVDYATWQRDKVMVPGIVESEKKEGGELFFTVSTKEFGLIEDINIKFLN